MPFLRDLKGRRNKHRRTQIHPRNRLAIEPLECRRLLAVVWSGAGDGTSWNDGGNWIGGQVPGGSDDAQIDAPGTPTIILAGAISVRSLTSSDAIQISSGSLTVTSGASLVTAGLAMDPGTSLLASGATTSFTVSGATSINSASIQAQHGAHVTLPITSYSINPGLQPMLRRLQ